MLTFRTPLILILFLFASCNITQRSAAIIPQKTLIIHSDILTGLPGDDLKKLEPITVDNIQQLKLIDRMGNGHISDIDIHPNGKTIAISTSTGIRLYDRVTLEEKPIGDERFRINLNSSQSPGAIAFSPDGKFLAITYYDNVVVWNLSEDREETQFYNIMPEFNVSILDFSADSKQIITYGYDLYNPCDALGAAYQIYDVDQGRLLYYRIICPLWGPKNFWVTSPGKIYFQGNTPETGENETTIIEASTGRLIETIRSDFSERIYDISPEGSLFAVKSQWDDPVTSLVSTKTRIVFKNIVGEVIFLPENDQLLVNPTGSYTGWKLMHSRGQHPGCTFSNNNDQLGTIAGISSIQATENYLIDASLDNEEIQIWNTSNCRLERRIRIPDAIYKPQISQDGKLIASGYVSHINIWDVEEERVIQSLPDTLEGEIANVFTFLSDDSLLAASQENDLTKLINFNLSTGEKNEVSLVDIDLSEFIISPDGKSMAISDQRRVHILDINDKHEFFRTEKYREINEMSFSPDGSELAIAVNDHYQDRMIILDVKSGTIIRKFDIDPANYKEEISKDWRFMITIDQDEFINIWDMDKGIIIHKLIGHHELTGEE